jgi:hypothetical protein
VNDRLIFLFGQLSTPSVPLRYYFNEAVANRVREPPQFHHFVAVHSTTMSKQHFHTDVISILIGLAASLALLFGGLGLLRLYNYAECHEETMPAIGSATQTFAEPYCLVENAGPLFRLRRRLFHPSWTTSYH